jgi:hypothetical protein
MVTEGRGPIRVGYRVTDLDLPFLLTRCYETNVFEDFRVGPGFVWTNVIAGPSYLDLSHFIGADMVSMEDWRGYFVGLTGPHDGGDMPDFYEAGEYEKMIEYIEDELEALSSSTMK